MNIVKFIVTIISFSFIGLIYWFFFGKKEGVVSANGLLKVKVSGGYKPEVIKLKKGVKTTLVFERTDPNTCLEEFILPDFKIKKYLPLNEEVEIALKPKKSGSFGFHCGMNMYHGKIVVES